jgi:3-phosphoshikimate 1-carboxyvinyltransferase
MKSHSVKTCGSFSCAFHLAGDKSIAHRALIISALADGATIIRNIPVNQDCLSTIEALRCFGVRIKKKLVKHPIASSFTLTVQGCGLRGFKQPRGDVFIGESGTTLRLLAGVAAGLPFRTEFDAGSSLSRRPMARITQPLRLMGARITACKVAHSQADEEYTPLVIQGGQLRGISYTLPVSSAQVKSAILLAGLNASGKTIVVEPVRTRDHTERMFKAFGASISVRGNTITLKGAQALVSPRSMVIPGDISSAAFFMVAAAILPDARVVLKNVSLNPYRTGIIKILKAMGARISCTMDKGERYLFEPAGTISVVSSPLRGVRIKQEDVPSLIDELPILMVAACCAAGRSTFEGINELRVKETDRIHSMMENLKAMGADIRLVSNAGKEALEISGGSQLQGIAARSFSDHRTAMSMVIAGLRASGVTTIDDVSCIDKSFPGFIHAVRKSCNRL